MIRGTKALKRNWQLLHPAICVLFVVVLFGFLVLLLLQPLPRAMAHWYPDYKVVADWLKLPQGRT
jgi:hypothetical protein